MKKLFYIILLASLIACNQADKKPDSTTAGPKSMSDSIINTYPHDTSSYTQGLIIYKGDMYEGTGMYRKSKLMKVDLKTGKILMAVEINKTKPPETPQDSLYFGEGITILRDTIYQLTWQSKVVFVYTLKDFKKVKEFKINTEGWGLTTDGKELIASDGTSNLYYYDPSTFKLLKTQDVTEGGSLSYNLNELEYIDGYVYANQYQAPYILKINPATGEIVAKADLSSMWDRIKDIDPQAEVPNGIAYDSATKKIYITGKLWPELYEVQFGQ